jgi:hypothetical protein
MIQSFVRRIEEFDWYISKNWGHAVASDGGGVVKSIRSEILELYLSNVTGTWTVIYYIAYYAVSVAQFVLTVKALVMSRIPLYRYWILNCLENNVLLSTVTVPVEDTEISSGVITLLVDPSRI